MKDHHLKSVKYHWINLNNLLTEKWRRQNIHKFCNNVVILIFNYFNTSPLPHSTRSSSSFPSSSPPPPSPPLPPPPCLQALQSVKELGFQYNLPLFSKVSDHRLSVFFIPILLKLSSTSSLNLLSCLPFFFVLSTVAVGSSSGIYCWYIFSTWPYNLSRRNFIIFKISVPCSMSFISWFDNILIQLEGERWIITA